MTFEFPRIGALFGDGFALRPLVDGDRAAVQAFVDAAPPGPECPDLPAGTGAAAWLAGMKSAHEAGEAMYLGICEQGGGDDGLRGCVSLEHVKGRPDTAEIGYWLLPDARGRGLAGRAVRLVCDYAFAALRLSVIEAVTSVFNERGARVAERAGFAAVARRNIPMPGRTKTVPAFVRRLYRHIYIKSTGAVCVTAGALLDGRGRVLMARRPADKAMGGLWEFPGGKTGESETAKAALSRELVEELAIRVPGQDLALFDFVSHSYACGDGHGAFRLLMPLFITERYDGRPQGREGNRPAFIPVDGFSRLTMPEADIPLARRFTAALSVKGKFTPPCV